MKKAFPVLVTHERTGIEHIFICALERTCTEEKSRVPSGIFPFSGLVMLLMRDARSHTDRRHRARPIEDFLPVPARQPLMILRRPNIRCWRGWADPGAL